MYYRHTSLIMTKELKQQLLKRIYSFLWRAGAYIAVAGLSAIVDILGLYKVDPTIIALVALVVGEITKYINTFALEK